MALPLPATITNKASLRHLLRLQRRELSKEYRTKARKIIEHKVFTTLRGKSLVASYCTINEELDTCGINAKLAKEGRLVLPKIKDETLELFQVEKLNKLTPGPFGIPEPDPAFSTKISLESLEAILVPGIAFDRNGHRLGYGKGYYDRLLSKKSEQCLAIGLAFKEQLINFSLPLDPHDQPMDLILTTGL